MQPFDKEYVCDIAKQILNIDSPTGYTKRAIDFMDEEAKKWMETEFWFVDLVVDEKRKKEYIPDAAWERI